MMVVLLLFCLAGVLADPGPLILTKYLSSPSIGRSMALVSLPAPFDHIVSYSGYFQLHRGNMAGRLTFFWFFEATEADPSSAPVVTWLQGGPGASSMFGVFGEHGPFSVSPNMTLVARDVAWTRKFNMLYIDNPCGVGFSQNNAGSDGFVSNETEVAEDLYDFIQQFFVIFPQFLPNPFFPAGESYGGKYTPSFAAYLAEQIAQGLSQINLKGIAVGDGALNPRIQFTGYADLAYYFSFADENEREVIKVYDKTIAQKIDQGDYLGAFAVFDELLNGDFYHYGTFFQNITGLSDYFNMLSPTYPPNPYPAFLNLASTKTLLHVGQSASYLDYNPAVETALKDDWMRDVIPALTSLMSNYSVLIYNGQLDFILGPPLALKVLRKIDWVRRDQFNAAPKMIWQVGSTTTVGGYVIEVQGLTHVTIRDAGHLAPADNAEATQDMINRFILGQGFGANK